MSEFKSSQQKEEQVLKIALFGTIDEDVVFPNVSLEGVKTVALDLEGVRTINSVGIREWLNWITPISEKVELVLSRCPKALVFQFNMVEGFLPSRAKVLSFYVPYFCEKCDREDNVLFSVGQDIQIVGGVVQVTKDVKATSACKGPDCELEMDVTESKYFQFLKKLG